MHYIVIHPDPREEDITEPCPVHEDQQQTVRVRYSYWRPVIDGVVAEQPSVRWRSMLVRCPTCAMERRQRRAQSVAKWRRSNPAVARERNRQYVAAHRARKKAEVAGQAE